MIGRISMEKYAKTNFQLTLRFEIYRISFFTVYSPYTAQVAEKISILIIFSYNAH